MNETGKRFLETNGEVQVVIAKLMVEHPHVSPAEWASHLFLCAAGMASIAGCGREDTQHEANYAVDLAYTTEKGGKITMN